MKQYFFRMVGMTGLSLALAACGGGGSGGSGGSSAGGSAPATPINVALATNGGVASATYGGTMANLVNDGDTTASNYWAGNVAGDTVTIDFGRLRTVSEITVHTNDTSFSSSNPAKYIEISADNSTWKTTAQPLGGDVSCLSLSMGSGKINCVFSTPQTIRYFRVRVTSTTPANQHIVEMEAMGT